MIYLGADHAGFELKEKIKKFLNKKKINYEDLTPKFKEGDDYPEIAFKIGEKVSRDRGNGILFCGSGNGMAIAANKVKGIRAVEAYDRISAKLSREDNDSNILVLGSWFIKEGNAEEIVLKWLNIRFSGLERHKRRIKKIEDYENGK